MRSECTPPEINRIGQVLKQMANYSVAEEFFQDMVESPIIEFQCLYRQWKWFKLSKEKNIIKIQAICRRWLACRELRCCNPSCSWRKFPRTRVIPPDWFYLFIGPNSVPAPTDPRYTDHEIQEWWVREATCQDYEYVDGQCELSSAFNVDGFFCLDCKMKLEFAECLDSMSDLDEMSEFYKIGTNGLPVGISLTPRQTGFLKMTINKVLGATYTGPSGPYCTGFMLEPDLESFEDVLKIWGISNWDWHMMMMPWISSYICPGRPNCVEFSHNEIMRNPCSFPCQKMLDTMFVGTKSLVNVDWALEGSLPGIMSLISYE